MASNGELPDDKMIQNGFKKNPLQALIYLALVAIVAALLWGGGNWLYNQQQQAREDDPFLKVSNRDFSLFLWQFPEYMRANVSAKTGYLPGFEYEQKVVMIPGEADKTVIAPPQVLFLYHVWSRLISQEFANRPISNRSLTTFLEEVPEWKPENWPGAPADYKALVEGLKTKALEDLPFNKIPWQVQQAIIGWRNFAVEGSQINQVKPTYGDMEKFLQKFPHYARNFWRNITMKGKPDYLKSLETGTFKPEDPVPENELASFLKVAYFNYQQSLKGL